MLLVLPQVVTETLEEYGDEDEDVERAKSGESLAPGAAANLLCIILLRFRLCAAANCRP